MTSGSGEIELARLRQGIYRFFATALLPPRKARIAQLEEAGFLLRDLGVDSLAFAPQWQDLCRCLGGKPSLDVLEVQYTRLFESGSDGALCPAVESYYITTPRHGGPAVVAADLEVEYQRLGLAFAGNSELGVDHISPQLELMALLCTNEADAVECCDMQAILNWNDEQRKFIDSHLAFWVPRFSARMREFAPPGLYRNLVTTLDTFVDHDGELIRVLARLGRTG